MATRIESYASSVLSGERSWNFYESTLGKFVAIIPIIGSVVNARALNHLKQQFQTEVAAANDLTSPDRVIQILQSKKHYHYVAIARSILTTSVLFCAFGTNFYTKLFVWFAAIDVLSTISKVTHNNKQMALVRNIGVAAASENGLSFDIESERRNDISNRESVRA